MTVLRLNLCLKAWPWRLNINICHPWLLPLGFERSIEFTGQHFRRPGRASRVKHSSGKLPWSSEDAVFAKRCANKRVQTGLDRCVFGSGATQNRNAFYGSNCSKLIGVHAWKGICRYDWKERKVNRIKSSNQYIWWLAYSEKAIWLFVRSSHL